jgi:hypothetical protein
MRASSGFGKKTRYVPITFRRTRDAASPSGGGERRDALARFRWGHNGRFP